MRNWGYKIKYTFLNTIKRGPKIVSDILIILGIVLTIAECMHYMFQSDIVYVWMHTYTFALISACVIASFLKNKVALKYEYFLNGSDVKINLQVTDVLRCEAAIVIPTNTTFDTIMEDEFISVNSVQGQFQMQYFENNLRTLDSLIEEGLKDIPYEMIDKKIGKCKRYPIGTVSKITYDKKHYYFVAIADINEYGKTFNTKFENIQASLEGIWRQLESRGHLETLAIPLIGTGKAGIKDATREKVIKEIVFSFIASAQERKITERLEICIHPSDLEHNDLQLQELDEYLRYMCKYRYKQEVSTIEGVAL